MISSLSLAKCLGYGTYSATVYELDQPKSWPEPGFLKKRAAEKQDEDPSDLHVRVTDGRLRETAPLKCPHKSFSQFEAKDAAIKPTVFYFILFFLFTDAPVAYGSSWARG